MESFLTKFFPKVSIGTKNAKHDAYCKYDDQRLTAFTSSLYIAAMLSSLVASRVTRMVGWQAVMLMGGVLFLVGSTINAGAVNIAMLIIGRMLLGFGVGFTTRAAPLYLTETSPARWRGAFTTAYNVFQVLGALAATVTNYFTNCIPGWGWRVSLGLAAVPAAIVVLGALLVPDNPSSLVLRGDTDGAWASLQRLRGPGAETDAELKDIVRAVEDARRNDEGAYARLFAKGITRVMSRAKINPRSLASSGDGRRRSAAVCRRWPATMRAETRITLINRAVAAATFPLVVRDSAGLRHAAVEGVGRAALRTQACGLVGSSLGGDAVVPRRADDRGYRQAGTPARRA